MRRLRRSALIGAFGLLLSTLVPAVQAAEPDVTTALTGHWRFDEPSGTTAHDSSPNNLHGTLRNGPTRDTLTKAPAPGNVSSLSLDGVDDFVDIADDPKFDTAHVTLSAWIRYAPGIGTGQRNIIRKGSLSDRSYGLDLTVSGTTTKTVRLRAFVNTTTSGGGTAIIDGGTKDLAPNTWYHVAMTYNGTSVTGYVDGAADGAGSSPMASDIYDNSLSVRIGGQTAGTAADRLSLQGHLDEVRVHNRALDGDSIKTLADPAAPTLAALSNQVVEATSASGATTSWTPVATDDIDPNPNVSCSPASGSTFPIGASNVSCTATDDAGHTSTPVTFTVTVQDTTAPTLGALSNQVIEATGASGATATWSPVATDSVDPNPDVSCSPASGSTFPIGTSNVSCTATDDAGNTSTPVTFTVTVQDTTAPTLTGMPSDRTVLATSASGAQVSWTDPGADDAVDPAPSVACVPASGSTFGPGTTTVTCTASDDAGNSDSETFNVSVAYNFTGFFRPVDNGGVLNVAKAGSAIPVKFNLGGYMGLNIFSTGSPATKLMACDSSATLDPIEETATAGGSSLSYDAASGQYTYVWKTNKAHAGTCRQLVITFADGNTKTANFRFTK
jgi:hypothetical protein